MQSGLESHFQRIGMQKPSLHVKYEAGQGPEIEQKMKMLKLSLLFECAGNINIEVTCIDGQ